MIHLDFTGPSGVLPVDLHDASAYADYTSHDVTHTATIDHTSFHESVKDSGPIGSKIGGTVVTQVIAALFWKGMGYVGDYVAGLNQGGAPNGTDPMGNNY